MLICPISGDVNCDLLVTALSVRFLHCEVTIFSFIFFIVVQVPLSPFPPHHSPCPTLDPTPLWLCPCVLYTCSLMTLPLFPPLSPSPHPLWSLSVCSLFKCLWFYFAHLLVFVVVVVD